SSQRFLIHLSTAEPNVFCMVNITENVSQKHFIGLDRFARICADGSADKPGNITIRERLAYFLRALSNISRAASDISRRAARGEQNAISNFAAKLQHPGTHGCQIHSNRA